MHGRFTSPDEFKGGPDELFDFEEDASDNPTFYADLTNPQSLNKYQYGYNNPYKYNDPTGHCPDCAAPAQVILGPTITQTIPMIRPWVPIATQVVRPAVRPAMPKPFPGTTDIVIIPKLAPLPIFGQPLPAGMTQPITITQGQGLQNARPKNLKPVRDAKGPHSTARRNKQNKVTRYTTWEKNPKNPTGNFTPRKSVDTQPGGRPHRNSQTKERVPTPHTQSDAKNSRGEPRIPGGVRPARPHELPKNQ